jgi:hypothetical protein
MYHYPSPSLTFESHLPGHQVLALLSALEGKHAEGFEKWTAGCRRMQEPRSLEPCRIAVMGNADKALEWLDRAVRISDDREDWLRRDPLLGSIRQHPRFQQILASAAYRRQQRWRTNAGSLIH